MSLYKNNEEALRAENAALRQELKKKKSPRKKKKMEIGENFSFFTTVFMLIICATILLGTCGLKVIACNQQSFTQSRIRSCIEMLKDRPNIKPQDCKDTFNNPNNF